MAASARSARRSKARPHPYAHHGLQRQIREQASTAFRDAVGSTANLGKADKNTYQMDPVTAMSAAKWR